MPAVKPVPFSSVFEIRRSACRQAVFEGFNGMNQRELAKKHGISVADVHAITQAAYRQRQDRLLISAASSVLETLVDQGLHQYLSDHQLEILIRRLREVGKTDDARRLRLIYLSRRQSCGDAPGRPGMGPRLRLALRILRLPVFLRWLTLGWRRVCSWLLIFG